EHVKEDGNDLIRKRIYKVEIGSLNEKKFWQYHTAQTMSNITKSFTEEVTAFKGRELHDRYAAIYMDATYIPLKRKTVAKEAIHIAVGIRPDEIGRASCRERGKRWVSEIE